MPRIVKLTLAGRTAVYALLAVCLAGLLTLAWTGSAYAMPARQESDEGCGCHSAERETWESSPHAQLDDSGLPIATCETCHGQYVRGHPEEGMIPLDADSAVCAGCHEQVDRQYEATLHAQAGIACVGCHMSHTQDLRLADQQLCRSCHRDSLKDSLHTAHWLGDAPCASCHMASDATLTREQLASGDATALLAATPRHDFVTVSADQCVDCHRAAVSAGEFAASGEHATRLAVLAAADQVPALRQALEGAEHAKRTLAIMSPLSLGFGISLGALFGIAFMLALARFSRPRGKS